jgi:hypothetical protein
MRILFPNFHEEQVRTPIHFSSVGNLVVKLVSLPFAPSHVKSSKPRLLGLEIGTNLFEILKYLSFWYYTTALLHYFIVHTHFSIYCARVEEMWLNINIYRDAKIKVIRSHNPEL